MVVKYVAFLERPCTIKLNLVCGNVHMLFTIVDCNRGYGHFRQELHLTPPQTFVVVDNAQRLHVRVPGVARHAHHRKVLICTRCVNTVAAAVLVHRLRHERVVAEAQVHRLAHVHGTVAASERYVLAHVGDAVQRLLTRTERHLRNSARRPRPSIVGVYRRGETGEALVLHALVVDARPL